MQSLEVISINLWQILISLCNLLILFLILKKFLYKPVRKMMKQRQDTLNLQYEQAKDAIRQAEEDKSAWEEKLQNAQGEADELLQTAKINANRRSEAIVSEAKEKADGIIRQAEVLAEQERRRAEEEIKHEIAGISTELTEKILSREIQEKDHRELIESFLQEIGENDDADR